MTEFEVFPSSTLLPLHRAVRNFRHAQTLRSRVSPLVVYYDGLRDLTHEMQLEWPLLGAHDLLTDYYNRFRTTGQISRTREDIGTTKIGCENRENVVEERGRRPVYEYNG